MTRLKDIAERVGVSISTVSRAISNDTARPVNKETKRKIREAAIALGYELDAEPERAPANRAKSIQTIGILLPQSVQENHPYFSAVLSGFRKKLQELGRAPAIVRPSEETDRPETMRAFVRETGVKGVLAIAWHDAELFALMREEGITVLGVSMHDETVSIPIVDCDRLAASRAAVRHLLARGHTRIGYIGGPGLADLESDERFLGYKFAMLEAGIAPNPEWVVNAYWRVDLSYGGMIDLLNRLPEEERPTAMFCASDMMAIPALRAAAEKKLRIPEDMAFVGMDNIEIAQYTSPPLTSVHVPKQEIGEVAAKTLIDCLEGQYPLPPKIWLPFEVVQRESSAFERSPDPSRQA
ncbi:LacI family DNA-binding transcriptional regulator [Paenibacillus flagellatus]|uniref:LacI family transcriptional regulator n=1 Tax=Paenibacillus flagellatus TaxID=2211139 RepID=A0A2V5K877_9BACL|nr:LacI family DNA-binding transcriptional regulator [Paenibacillus flagellatus]PYI55671.1 LacI family transcriptional regulator [Paenibacillus flagellatus]